MLVASNRYNLGAPMQATTADRRHLTRDRLADAAIGAWRAFFGRALIGGIMVIMGLGRLGVYKTATLADILPTATYGALLLVIGGALLVTHRWRHTWWGRGTCAVGALLLAAMAWDIGYIGVTSLLEAAMALSLLGSTLLNGDCF
jgi:hypothetical protein